MDRLAKAGDDFVLRGEAVILELAAQVALEEELAGPAVDDLEFFVKPFDPPFQVADALLGPVDRLELLELLAVRLDLREPVVVLGAERFGGLLALPDRIEQFAADGDRSRCRVAVEQR